MVTKALVILSGGQDSTTCLFEAMQKFDQIYCLTFDYNQRHNREIQAAKDVVKLVSEEVYAHEILKLDNILRGKSPLTDKGEELETYSNFNEMEKTIGDRVELTFVPMRNALFLNIAANRAVCEGITDIYTGVCQADGTNYPDCTPRFIAAQQSAINKALGSDCITIHTPLMNLTKSESIIKALSVFDCYTALAYTHTAYSGQFPPIMQDHATVLRAHGFEQANVPDPLIVRAWLEYKLGSLPSTPNYEICIRHDLRKNCSNVLETLQRLEEIVVWEKFGIETI